MEAFSYLLTIGICSLGLVVGAIVSFMAKEELKSGLAYFLWLKRVLLMVVLGTFIYLYKSSIIYVSVIVVWMVVSYLFLIDNDILTYSLFGIAISESALSQPVFIINSISLFLYGLPTAAISIAKHREEGGRYAAKKLLITGLLFVVISALLYFA
jgi:hypothetical protein